MLSRPLKISQIFYLLVFMVMFPAWDIGNNLSVKTREANELFKQEKYEDALKKYTDAQLEAPESPVLYYNIGNVLYEQKKYAEAINEYQKSLSSDDILHQSQAYYNIGNCQFRMDKLDEAIISYTKALELSPDDEDAKYNLELTRRILKELAQKQQKEQQQQDKDQQQQQQQDEQQQGTQNEKEQQQSQDQKNSDENKESSMKENETQESGDEQEENKEESSAQQKPGDESEKMTEEEAMRLLNAMEESEKDYQKEERKFKAPKGAKPKYDW